VTGPSVGSPERVTELTERLATVRARIADACAAAGRASGAVDLLAVTKTVPASDVAILLDLGLTDFGENRVQEAGEKVGAVAELGRSMPEMSVSWPRPRWFFVGGVQRNKAKAVVRWADRVDSVDSMRLADALDSAVRRALDAGQRPDPLPVLLQYSVDGDPSRGGVPRADLLTLAEHVAACAGLRLDGIMAVAPLTGTPVDEAFADIAEAAAELRSAHPSATVLSAGMSGDLDVAIRHGSTVVRVGTALVGERRLTSR
jgi:pyridoxal phosphate enzyme (YggS family)